MSSSLFPLLYSLVLLCFSGNVATGTTSFDFQTLSVTSSFKFLGEAHLFNNTIRLTPDLLVPNTVAGRVLYNNPVRFLQPGNLTPVSFTTTFSFTIANLNPGSIGGGLAFVISPNDEAIGEAGGHLGVPTGAVAVEFDTSMDVEFKDVNGNHVGLDLDSMVSGHVADLELVKVNLRSGELVNCWIDYSGSTYQFNISVSYSDTKPESPVLSITINLNKYLNELMFIGFSGSTQGSTEIHSLQRWSFNSSFAEPSSPPPTTTTPMAPIIQEHRTLGFLFLMGSLLAAAAAAVAAVTVKLSVYCIRNCNVHVNNISINCCMRRMSSSKRTRLESDVSPDSPIRNHEAVV